MKVSDVILISGPFGWFWPVLVGLISVKYYQNSSKGDKIMKLGRMVHIDHMNKFSPVAKMNYGYVGQRSRSKSAEVEKIGHIEKTFKTCHVWYQIEHFHLCNPSRHVIRMPEVFRSKFTLKVGQRSYLPDFVFAKMTSTLACLVSNEMVWKTLFIDWY